MQRKFERTLPSIGHLREKLDAIAVIGHWVSEAQE
jgi:hypothetical protein